MGGKEKDRSGELAEGICKAVCLILSQWKSLSYKKEKGGV